MQATHKRKTIFYEATSDKYFTTTLWEIWVKACRTVNITCMNHKVIKPSQHS